MNDFEQKWLDHLNDPETQDSFSKCIHIATMRDIGFLHLSPNALLEDLLEPERVGEKYCRFIAALKITGEYEERHANPCANVY